MPSYPGNDALFSLWLGNFLSVANANLSALGMTAADITALQTLKNDLDDKLAIETTAKEAAVAATAGKNTSRKNVNVQASFRSKVILANPNVSNALKEQLGLTVKSPPTITPPVVPIGLFARPLAAGKTNQLEWSGNGNKQGTTYVIEKKTSQNGGWSILDTTTKTKYDHLNQTPGRAIAYRVRAKRSDLVSEYSNEAVAYVDAAFPLEENGITG